MEGVRNRRATNEMRASSGTRSNQKRRTSVPVKLFMYLLILIAFSLGLIVILYNLLPMSRSSHEAQFLDHLSAHVGLRERVHVVIIDAGSTGSRVLAFTFLKSNIDNSLKLEDELWHEVKPGLSSYKDNPVQAAESLIPLLEMAQSHIPQNKWSETPVVLRATAGLRLLSPGHADRLLSETSKFLEKSVFLSNNRSVDILDGKDEGLFSWFTCNYLYDLIQAKPEDTLVALDLGGGSTQITFIPTSPNTFDSVPKEHLTTISLYHVDRQVFTRSYLGLGLMAGRSAVLSSHLTGGRLVRSPCVNPIVNTTWEYHGNFYVVAGPENFKYLEVASKDGHVTDKVPIADFQRCYQTCAQVIKKQVKEELSELNQRKVVAFSYFFDRAAEQAMIDALSGGTVKVKRFVEEAKRVCELPNVDQPFACLDLTYITAFLRHGYGLHDDSEITLCKKIKNREVSWALGLGFHIVSNGV